MLSKELMVDLNNACVTEDFDESPHATLKRAASDSLAEYRTLLTSNKPGKEALLQGAEATLGQYIGDLVAIDPTFLTLQDRLKSELAPKLPAAQSLAARAVTGWGSGR